MINNFTKDSIVVMRDAIQKALNKVGETYGLTIKLGNMRYDDFTFTSKIEVKINGKDDEINRKEFDRACQKYGLKPSDYGRVFNVNGTDYKVVTLRTRNRKYPVIAERVSDGKSFKFAPFIVKMNSFEQAS